MRIFLVLLLSVSAWAQSFVVKVDADNSATTGQITWHCEKDGVTVLMQTSHLPMGLSKRAREAHLREARDNCKEANTAAIVPEFRDENATPIAHTHTAANVDTGTLGDARLSANVSLLGQTIGGAELGNPAAGTKGGVEALTCSGTDKFSAIGTNGVPVCAADVSGGGSGATSLRITSADHSHSTTAYADVTGLTLAVNAGTHNITCNLIVSAAATTTGIQIALNGPANSFLRYHSEYFTAATAKAVWSSTTYDPATAANGTLPVTSAGTVITSYTLIGQIVATGSGTIAVRGKSEVSSSAITIYRGSSCTVF